MTLLKYNIYNQTYDLMLAKVIKEPNLSLNLSKEQLFVSNFANQKYSHMMTSGGNAQIKFDPFTIVKKKLISEAKTHQDIRDCSTVLTG